MIDTIGRVFAPTGQSELGKRLAADEKGPFLPPYRTPSGYSALGPKKALLIAICVFSGLLYGASITIFPYFLYPVLAVPFIPLLLFIVWLLPENPRSSLSKSAWLAFGFFIALGVWPNYMSFYIPGLPWISFRRLFSIPLTMVFLVYISANRAARGLIVDTFNNYRLFSYTFLAFTVTQFLSLVGSPHLFTAMNRYIINQISWTIPFFVFLLVFRDPKYIRRFMIALCVVGIGLAILGLVEYRLNRVLWANHIPSFLKVDASQIQAVLFGSYREGMYRTIGIWADTLSFAEYLSVSIVFLLYFLFSAQGIGRLLLLLAVDVMMLVSIYYTGARLGLFGALLAHLLFGFGWAYSRWYAKKNDMVAPAILLLYPIGLFATCAAMLFVGRIRGAFIGNGAQDSSDQGRIDQFAKAPGIIARRILFGYGPGEGGVALDYHQPGGLLTVDSYLLTASLDYGLVGFVGFFGMMIACIFYGIRAFAFGSSKGDLRILTAVAALSVYALIRLVLSQEENQPLLFMFMALILAMCQTARTRRPQAHSGLPRTLPGLGRPLPERSSVVPKQRLIVAPWRR